MSTEATQSDTQPAGAPAQGSPMPAAEKVRPASGAASPAPINAPVRRVIQRRATGHDFNLFHAIVGTQPIMAPRAAEQAVRSAMAAIPPVLDANPPRDKRLKIPSIPKPTWSAAAFAAHVRDFCERELRGRVNRPNMAIWMRHVSDEAIKRIEEAQARLASSRGRGATRADQRRRAA